MEQEIIYRGIISCSHCDDPSINVELIHVLAIGINACPSNDTYKEFHFLLLTSQLHTSPRFTGN